MEFTSRFGIGEKVKVKGFSSPCEVVKVEFTEDKVVYHVFGVNDDESFYAILPSEEVLSVEISATDAVYGVLAWLSSQPVRLTISDKDDASIVARAASAFIRSNNLPEPSSYYPVNLEYPEEGWENG